MNVYALVVYTGKQTKLVLNEGKYSFKISDLTSKTNWYLAFNILTMIMIMLLYSQIGNRYWMQNYADKHYYIFPESEKPINKEEYTMKSMMSFFLLLNTIVPLDLGVVWNIAKGVYTLRMIYDVDMVDIERSEQDK